MPQRYARPARYDAARYDIPYKSVNAIRMRNISEWIGIVALAVIVALLLQAYVVQAFWIPSDSMVPTLHTGDRLLVNKLDYRFGDLHHGDIVVFKRPPSLPDKSVNDLIKRVIGLPGDVIESRNGLLYRNGQPVKEPYLPSPNTITGDIPDPIKVEPGNVLLLGDNRPDSYDGRYWGQVSQKLIVGKAVFRMWPLNQISPL